MKHKQHKYSRTYLIKCIQINFFTEQLWGDPEDTGRPAWSWIHHRSRSSSDERKVGRVAGNHLRSPDRFPASSKANTQEENPEGANEYTKDSKKQCKIHKEVLHSQSGYPAIQASHNTD